MRNTKPSFEGSAPRVLSCGVVVVRWFDGELKYLLLRVYKHWDFPKGIKEFGETPLDAAVREVEEETTLRELDFRWGYQYRTTALYRGNKVAHFFLAHSPDAQVSIPVNPELGWPEHHDYEWLVYGVARERLSERLRLILDWAHAVVGEGPTHANPS